MIKNRLKLLVLSLLLFAYIFQGKSVYVNAEDGLYVNDHAGVLSDSDLGKLKEELDILSDKWDVDIVVVTESSLNGINEQDYADDYFDYNGYRKDGVLLLLVMDTRSWYISTTGSCINTFTDDGIQYIGSQLVSYLKDGDYYGALSKYGKLCDTYLAQDEKGEPYDGSNMPHDASDVAAVVLIAFVISLVLTGLIIFTLCMLNFSVKTNKAAANYMVRDSLRLIDTSEMFLYKNVTRVKIESDSSRSSGGGGGGSSTHIGSSGTSHGGGGGHW